MARCNCGNQTCSCIITGGDGVLVEGNGTPTRPYEISVESALLLSDQLGVVDTSTLDLTIVGTGAPGSKMMLSGVATQSMTGLKDVNDPSPPTNGDVPTWVNDHWEFKPVTAASSLPVFTWGAAPLDDYGVVANSTQGQAVYLDSGGNLRSQPLVIDSAVLLTNADVLAKYPVGVSIYNLSTAQASAGGWPVANSGTVVTEVRSDGITAVQRYTRNANTQATTDTRWRVFSTTWQPWQREVFTPDTPADGQVPVWRSATGKFTMEAQTGSGGGGGTEEVVIGGTTPAAPLELWVDTSVSAPPVVSGQVLIQAGSVNIVPVANTPTAKAIGFPFAYTSNPYVVCTANTAVPGSGVEEVSYGNITTTGCNIYIYRTNTTSCDISWIAFGTAA